MNRQLISPREQQVLHLIAHEHSSEEIARELFISTHTVISHRKNLLSKLNVKNTAGLVRKAFEFGLLRLNMQITVCLLLFFSIGIQNSSAQVTKTWTGNIDNKWHKANNWSPTGVPTIKDIVIVDRDSVLIINGITGSCSEIFIDAQVKLLINTTGKLNVGLSADHGITNAGIIDCKGTINIVRPDKKGIINRSSGYIDIAAGALINIDTAGVHGIENSGFIQNSGEIDIDSTGSKGLRNTAGSTLSNVVGIINIMFTGDNGIENLGTYINNAYSTTSILHSGNIAFNNKSVVSNNTLAVMSLSHSDIGLSNDDNTSVSFINSGTLSIQHITITGLSLIEDFTNNGNINILNCDEEGIAFQDNHNTFHNNAGASLTLENIVEVGFDLYNNRIINNGSIILKNNQGTGIDGGDYNGQIYNHGYIEIGEHTSGSPYGTYLVDSIYNHDGGHINISNFHSSSGHPLSCHKLINDGLITSDDVSGDRTGYIIFLTNNDSISLHNSGSLNSNYFTNNSTGYISVNQSSSEGLHVIVEGTNDGEIMLNKNTTNSTFQDFINNGSIDFNYCEEITFMGEFLNSSTGRMVIDSADGIIILNTFTNDNYISISNNEVDVAINSIGKIINNDTLQVINSHEGFDIINVDNTLTNNGVILVDSIDDTAITIGTGSLTNNNTIEIKNVGDQGVRNTDGHIENYGSITFDHIGKTAVLTSGQSFVNNTSGKIYISNSDHSLRVAAGATSNYGEINISESNNTGMHIESAFVNEYCGSIFIESKFFSTSSGFTNKGFIRQESENINSLIFASTFTNEGIYVDVNGSSAGQVGYTNNGISIDTIEGTHTTLDTTIYNPITMQNENVQLPLFASLYEGSNTEEVNPIKITLDSIGIATAGLVHAANGNFGFIPIIGVEGKTKVYVHYEMPNGCLYIVPLHFENPLPCEMCENNTNTWTGDANTTDWFTANNWSLDIVPLRFHETTIPAGAIVVIPSGMTAECSQLDVAIGACITIDGEIEIIGAPE